MIVPLVTDTVTGNAIAWVPSEIVIVVEPLRFEPMPIDVATNEPVDAGDVDVDTVTDDGDTVTIVASLVAAVNVPLNPFSLTVNDWLPFGPPKAMLAGLTTGVGDGVGVGVGVGEGVGLGVGVGDTLEVGEALADALADELGAAVAVADAFGDAPPPPPQPTSTASATIPTRTTTFRCPARPARECALRITYQTFGYFLAPI